MKPLKRKGRPFWFFRWRNSDGDWVNRQSEVPRTASRDDALRAAMALQLQLTGAADRKVNNREWLDAVTRFEAARVTKAKKTLSQWRTALNHVYRIGAPKRCSDLTTDWVDDFTATLRSEGKPDTTIAAYLRCLKVFARYAERKRWIDKSDAPDFEMPEGVTRVQRSRALNFEQFELVLAAAEKVRPVDHEYWKTFLWGLWHTGMRVSELHALGWNEGEVVIDYSRKFPGFLFTKQKNKKHQWVPMTPEFHKLFVAGVETRKRQGFFFHVPGNQPGKEGRRVNAQTAMRICNDIGEASRIRTGGTPAKPKFATTADYGRRAFATRHRAFLSHWDLAEMMRHKDPSTTDIFYADGRGEALAEKLWLNCGEEPPSKRDFLP